MPDASVPAGKDEDDNVELHRWGTLPELFEPKIMELTAGGSWISIRRLNIRGSLCGHAWPGGPHAPGFDQFMLDTHVQQNGYEEVYVPYIVNADSLYGTGQLPKFAEDQFRLDQEQETYLIPTAEVPVTNIYRDEIIDAEALPLRHVCHTPCFRSEAGSYGRDTRGMIRQHQFEKVELVQLVRPEDSWDALDELTGHAEAILKALELPYRAVVPAALGLCGKTIDLEVWLPAQNKYQEISSCSNFLDFQARRIQARYPILKAASLNLSIRSTVRA